MMSRSWFLCLLLSHTFTNLNSSAPSREGEREQIFKAFFSPHIWCLTGFDFGITLSLTHMTSNNYFPVVKDPKFCPAHKMQSKENLIKLKVLPDEQDFSYSQFYTVCEWLCVYAFAECFVLRVTRYVDLQNLCLTYFEVTD